MAVKKWLLAAVAALVCLLAWGGWVWSHPTVLTDTSALGNFDFDPRPVSTTYFVGVAGSSATHSREVVTLRKVTPHLARNSAHAEVSVHICRTRGMGAAGSMTDMADVNEVCKSFEPFRPGQKLRLFGGPGRDEIVLRIAPTRPGKTRIDKVSFSYTRDRGHLWQRGTDVSEQDWRVTAR